MNTYKITDTFVIKQGKVITLSLMDNHLSNETVKVKQLIGEVLMYNGSLFVCKGIEALKTVDYSKHEDVVRDKVGLLLAPIKDNQTYLCGEVGATGKWWSDTLYQLTTPEAKADFAFMWHA